MKDLRKTQFARHRKCIREILLRDWDPIGVRDIPEASDEYDGYIPGVYRHLVDSASEAQLVDYLSRIETVNMGLPGSDKAKLSIVAEKILMLMDEQSQPTT